MDLQNIFAQGYGQIRFYEVSSFGLKPSYVKNPNMSQSARKKAPIYVIEPTEQQLAESKEVAKTYQAAQAKEISIYDYAKKVSKANNGKIVHKSKSGSVYVKVGVQTIRISNHFILDIDPMNQKVRHDFEIVQKSFDERTEVLIIAK